MKQLLLATILFPVCIKAQDSLLTYSRILTIDSIGKNAIYDRALVWCSKSFNSSQSAVNVSDKEGGIIAGKGSYDSYYKVPGKRDSIVSYTFSNYFFDWLIEIKEGKARFSLKNIVLRESNGDHPVTMGGKPPIKVMFQSPSKTQIEWDMSKKYFVRNMDAIVNNLYADLKKNDNW